MRREGELVQGQSQKPKQPTAGENTQSIIPQQAHTKSAVLLCLRVMIECDVGVNKNRLGTRLEMKYTPTPDVYGTWELSPGDWMLAV